MKTRPQSRAFIAAAVLLLGASFLLSGQQPSSHQRPPATAAPATRTEPPVVPERGSDTTPAAQASRSVPALRRTASLEHEPPRASAVSPGDARLATGAARVFLDGYLRFTYGHGTAMAIRAAAGRLVRVLDDAPPRVPAAVARAHPRVTTVRAKATTAAREVIVI